MENCQSMQIVISMFIFFLVILSLNFIFGASPVEIDMKLDIFVKKQINYVVLIH